MCAKIVFGAMVQAASGRVGGVVFHTGKRADVVSRLAVRTRVCSSVQGSRRAALGNIATHWRNLSEGQRTAWRQWAARNLFPDIFGVPRARSGFQAYCGYALGIDPSGEAWVSAVAPPGGGLTQAPNIVSVTATAPQSLVVNFGNVFATTTTVYSFLRWEIGRAGLSPRGCAMGAWVSTAASGENDLSNWLYVTGVTLRGGEVIEYGCHLVEASRYPSSRVRVTVTVGT